MAAAALGAPVLVIGTAHVIDLAGPLRSVLGDRPLDGIAVELDAERAPAVLGPKPAGGRARDVPLFARLWGLLQRRLGAELGGGAPGAEMRAAADVARARGLPLFLIDDPIRATLARLLATMPFKERVTLVAGAVVGLFVPARVVSGQLEHYVDEPTEMIAELRRASPTIARVLIDERNEHMADRVATIRARGAGRLAVVVGDAHVTGLRIALGQRGVPTEGLPFRDLRGLRGPSSSPSSPR
ncbi:MAG TPA: TraB/GumN family protein [Thermoplasmata archaeon]|nr:TraB/GumN family protein [Thermoplasmata archaeon]